jgi:hypothetical protein
MRGSTRKWRAPHDLGPIPPFLSLATSLDRFGADRTERRLLLALAASVAGVVQVEATEGRLMPIALVRRRRQDGLDVGPEAMSTCVVGRQRTRDRPSAIEAGQVGIVEASRDGGREGAMRERGLALTRGRDGCGIDDLAVLRLGRSRVADDLGDTSLLEWSVRRLLIDLWTGEGTCGGDNGDPGVSRSESGVDGNGVVCGRPKEGGFRRDFNAFMTVARNLAVATGDQVESARFRTCVEQSSSARSARQRETCRDTGTSRCAVEVGI